MRSYLMQDEYGQVEEAQSISAGLDYPGVGPEHAHLHAIGRAEYPPSATTRCSPRSRCSPAPRASSPPSSRRTPSPGSIREAPALAGRTVLVNLSGRGDKDVAQAMELLA